MTLQNHVTEGVEALMVYHHHAKFGDHRYSSNRDMFLVCHVIKQEHRIKGPGDYNDKRP